LTIFHFSTQVNDMPIIAEERAGFAPLDAGEYLGRCVSVVFLGVVPNPYGAPKPRVVFEFEVENEFLKNGDPRKLMQEFTLTLDRRGSLRPFLERWRGKPFDPNSLARFELDQLLNVGCRLLVGQAQKRDGGMKAVIDAALPLPKGTELSPPISPLTLFDASEPDISVFHRLPPFLQEKIRSAEKPEPVAKTPEPAFDDAIPF
jgi:hypothetical protein